MQPLILVSGFLLLTMIGACSGEQAAERATNAGGGGSAGTVGAADGSVTIGAGGTVTTTGGDVSSGGSSIDGPSSGGGAAVGGASGGSGNVPGDASEARGTLDVLTACGSRSQLPCGYVFAGPICSAIDAEYAAAHDDACIDAAVDAFHCEAELGCPGLKMYLQAPTEHPYCGMKAKHYQETCGFKPQPAAGCVAYCEKVSACEPNAQKAGCEYDCNLEVGGLAIGRPQGCGEAFDALYACFAMMDCKGIHDHLTQQTLPWTCANVHVAASMACK